MKKMVIYKSDNEMVADLLLMYCEGKSFLWNMFFGWRESKVLPNGSNLYTFKVPRNIWQMAEKVAKRYDYEVVED